MTNESILRMYSSDVEIQKKKDVVNNKSNICKIWNILGGRYKSGEWIVDIVWIHKENKEQEEGI